MFVIHSEVDILDHACPVPVEAAASMCMYVCICVCLVVPGVYLMSSQCCVWEWRGGLWNARNVATTNYEYHYVATSHLAVVDLISFFISSLAYCREIHVHSISLSV